MHAHPVEKKKGKKRSFLHIISILKILTHISGKNNNKDRWKATAVHCSLKYS